MSEVEIKTYIEEIEKMQNPEEVINLLHKLMNENPNDSALGNIVRRIVFKLKK